MNVDKYYDYFEDVERLVENDAISAKEEGFLRGYYSDEE
jgi:hypothetical protein